jgi:putative transposase
MDPGHHQAPRPARGIFYQLYVLIDIYSRFNPSWIISPVEDSLLAKDFIAEAIERNGATPHTVHADRGTSMTSRPGSALLADPGVTRSHSRPHVSNDNPYSEAQFKCATNVEEGRCRRSLGCGAVQMMKG